jgi:predicted protein tyrosine phosphatase
MEFFVYSRRAIEAVEPHDVAHIIISITSAVDDRARLRTNEHCKGVLRLRFLDADAPSEQFAEADLFASGHADEMWAFVLRHREVARIVVHCDAGMSRSPAVAGALARVLTGSDADFFSGRYRPNMRVYRTILDRAPEHLTEALSDVMT